MTGTYPSCRAARRIGRSLPGNPPTRTGTPGRCTGRGRNVTVHYGRQDCSFPAQPDRKIRLESEPRDLSLVRIRDFNGDGRSDLLVVHPRTTRDRDPGLAPPVRLEFHWSDKGGAR